MEFDYESIKKPLDRLIKYWCSLQQKFSDRFTAYYDDCFDYGNYEDDYNEPNNHMNENK